MSTIVRQWHLLALLPQAPRRVDVARLAVLLRARGFRVHRRTIQRDLVELSRVFPIVRDRRTKPYAWRWADGVTAPVVPFPVTEAAGPPSHGSAASGR